MYFGGTSEPARETAAAHGYLIKDLWTRQLSETAATKVRDLLARGAGRFGNGNFHVAGVSVASVSRVLSGNYPVSEELRRRVQARHAAAGEVAAEVQGEVEVVDAGVVGVDAFVGGDHPALANEAAGLVEDGDLVGGGRCRRGRRGGRPRCR